MHQPTVAHMPTERYFSLIGQQQVTNDVTEFDENVKVSNYKTKLAYYAQFEWNLLVWFEFDDVDQIDFIGHQAIEF